MFQSPTAVGEFLKLMITPVPLSKMMHTRDRIGRRRHPNQNRGTSPPPSGDGGESLACPPHLDATGREAWVELHALMKDAGTLDSADCKLLELFASSYSRLRRAQEHIEENGEVLTLRTDRGAETIRKNPSVDIENTCTDRCMRILSQCGISLQSRARLGLEKIDDEPDPLAELMLK